MAKTRPVVISPGVRAPYPNPTSATASKVARGNRKRDTKPEVALRSALHRAGLRFRKNVVVRSNDVRVTVDVVFPRQKVLVFVDGCFWHGCETHQRIPATNTAYWVPKLRSNIERDRRVDIHLRQAGWMVERVWEHEDPAEAALRVAELVRRGASSRGIAGATR
jgi:DNA mismatch endonuclease, patch repair protein